MTRRALLAISSVLHIFVCLSKLTSPLPLLGSLSGPIFAGVAVSLLLYLLLWVCFIFCSQSFNNARIARLQIFSVTSAVSVEDCSSERVKAF